MKNYLKTIVDGYEPVNQFYSDSFQYNPLIKISINSNSF